MNTRNVNSETKGPSAFDRFEQYSRMLNSLPGRITFVIARVLFNIITLPVVVISYLAQKVVTIWNENQRSDTRKTTEVFFDKAKGEVVEYFRDPVEKMIEIRNEQMAASFAKENPPVTKTELAKKKAIKKSVNKQIKEKSLSYKGFNEILKDWEKQAPKGENRKEAAIRIKTFAFLNKSKKSHRSCLDLSDLCLSSLPNVFLPDLSGAYRFLNMQELNLKGNKLIALPKSIENLKSLEELNLEDNQITVLPKQAFEKLRTLQVLNLKGNQLTSLPKEVFANLKALQDLNLGNNQIRELPENIFDHLQLNALSLKGNELKVLPESFNKLLPYLRMLNLKDNQIRKDDLKIIKQQKDLKFLYGTSIRFNRKKVFKQTTELYKTIGKRVTG